MAAKLRIHTVTGEKYEVPIQNTATIGRTSDNTVCLNTSAHISRQHAIIRCHNGYEYQIMDLGSRNGTYVNDQRVVLPVTLVNGAKIRIANNEILFEQEAEHGGEDAIEATLAASTDQHAQSVRPAAILVCDIRGFSTQSEKIPAEGLSQILGQWFREAGNVVQRSGGIIDKFIGDAILAYWQPGQATPSATTPDGPSPECAAAFEAGCAMLRMASKMKWPNEKPFEVGVALHHGKVSFSNIGLVAQRDATIIGDAVNTAFRLESIMKELKQKLLLSERIVDMMPEKEMFVDLGEKALKGKAQLVRVFGMKPDFQF
jgi:adenylate cyclase